MAKGRVRAKRTKGKRWSKGHSCSSNPKSSKHRQAARGKFGSHLTQGRSSGPPLTSEALASHEALQDDELALDSDGDVDFLEEESRPGRSKTGSTSVATSSAYSLIETAHPVFGQVKKLWRSPLESHREICAVLAAISEVIKTHKGRDTETEYFGALMTSLESAEEEKSVTAIAYLLCIVMTKVPTEVLQARYSAVCKVITDTLSAHETSGSTALLISLVKSLSALLSVQDVSVWTDGYTQKVFQSLLNFTIHPKPRLRKAAQSGVASMLREGTITGDFHPSAGYTARHCKHVIEKGGSETSTLHVLGMLKNCLANFPTQHIKTLCETVLKLMTLGNVVVRTTGLRALHGLFSSVAGPRGITPQLNGKLISALYDYQPSLVDAQLLQAWLTVMEEAHQRLASQEMELCAAHLPRLFSTCTSCLLSDKTAVTTTAATTMETLLKRYVGPFMESRDVEKSKRQHSNIEKAFKAVESGLKYKFHSSWDIVLRVMGTFYQVAGRQCSSFMSKSLVSLCELRSTVNFPYTGELDSAFGAAVRTMGPRIVLEAVPLQLDVESDPPDFSRSWMLPVLKDHVQCTELGYFTEALLPLAGRLRAKAQQYSQAGKLIEEKLYDTLQIQIWSLLPGFCTGPVDLKQSFPSIARILGTAMNERLDLRNTVAQSLRLLIERNRDNEENRAELSRFSKNYLPILFNLYTTDPKPGDPPKGPLLDCIKAYVSITEQQLLHSFFSKALGKMRQEDLAASAKYVVCDLLHAFVPYLSLELLNQLFLFITPFLDTGDGTMQKKAYSILECMLSCEGPVHSGFRREHLGELQKLLMDSLSTASAASKKPRLKCLLHITSHLTPDSAEFIAATAPEVILCTKEVNEKTRLLSFKVLVSLGYATQRCFRKSAEESVTDYFVIILAGLAGSPRMISATLMALARLVYEFHDLLGSNVVRKLLSNACVFLSAKTREVVRAALEFVKVTIGVLPPGELAPHVEDLVSSILNWSENSRNHFRLKARVILERLIRKFSYEMIASMVPEKHRKLVVHIHKTTERGKRRKQAKGEKEETEEEGTVRRHQKPSFEDLLYESSDEEKEITKRSKGSKIKDRTAAKKVRGGAWIKESSRDEPVNFLDQSVVKRVVATNPATLKRRRPGSSPFKTTPEGRLVIMEEEEEGDKTTKASAVVEEMEVDNVELQAKRVKRKRKQQEEEEEEENTGGGTGIYRKNPSKLDFDYGADYRAKRARGDIKRRGKPAPYAYVPLLRQKLNRRKQAKLVGQFTGLMKKAKKGSALGTKQRKRKR